MPSSVPSTLGELVQPHLESLREYGWHVELKLDVEHPTVVFHHVLTTSMAVTLSQDLEQSEAVITEILAHPEFEMIAQAPVAMPHTKLAGALREAGAAHRWNRDVIVTIALVLRANGILNDEEARWLRQAGVPWELGETGT